MNIFIAMQAWNILNWILFFLIGVFIVLWVTGNKFLTDIYERALRFEQFDQYYEYPGGIFLLHLRNLLVVIVLFIIFKII